MPAQVLDTLPDAVGAQITLKTSGLVTATKVAADRVVAYSDVAASVVLAAVATHVVPHVQASVGMMAVALQVVASAFEIGYVEAVEDVVSK